MKPITIYSSTSCAYCVRAKQLLHMRGAAFNEINVDGDSDTRMALMQRTGRRTVPQIFIGECHVGGYDDLAALDRSGGLQAALSAE